MPRASTQFGLNSLIFSEQLGESPEPYERLLSDAMRGECNQFAREDGVEETWRIVQPLLDATPPLSPTSPGRGARPAQTNCWPGTRVGESLGCTRTRRTGPMSGQVPGRKG